jgi:tetratricopeptide (TPR) repeat protein
MPRRLSIALLSVWPGLAQIWTGQEALGLILATGFAASLNLAIISKYLWTEAFAAGLPGFFATLAVLTWLAAFSYTIWWLWRCHPARHKEAIDTLFREACELYLQGKWDDSRKILERILALDDTDADALMQLGTLYQRTGQTEFARTTYKQCLELEAGAKWSWEISRALKAMNSPVQREEPGIAA